MSEKYFFFAVLAGLIFFISGLFCVVLFYLRYKHLKKLAQLNILKRQQLSKQKHFYSTAVLEEAIFELFFNFHHSAQNALTFLVCGRPAKAADYLKNKKQALSLLLKAHFISLEPIYNKLRKLPKKLKTPFILLATAHISHLLFKDEDIAGIISKIKKKRLSAKLAAYKNYLSSFAYLQEGDMLSASENASAALKFFQKKRYFFEEAQSYLLLAEIYRVSCVNDVAQTMIESALKIFESAKLQFFKAQTIAVLGMLMLFENRIDEACDKLTLAKNISLSNELTADISNQIALVCLAQKNEKDALKHSKQALTLYLRQHNERGEAFSRQLIGHFLLNGGKTSQAFNSARKAADLYLGQQNFSAYAETLYLQARALCQLEKYDQAEKKLRLILSENRKHSLNFHIAHAYSLLALIFLRKKNLQRAKVLLQQSLMLEQNHERCSGLASDYANLALIEKLSGNFEAAKNNLKQALEYAKESGDENLLQLIKEQKNNI